MTSSPPSVESVDDRLKDLGLLYDAAFQNSDYEWQGKQFTEAYDRLHRFVEAQQTDALSGLRTQIEAKEFADLAAEWQKLYDTDRSDYHDKGVTYTTISPSVWLLTHTIKALEVGYHLAKLDSAEARKK